MNVVVTGASQGLGAALAREFSALGHAVLLSARREIQLRAVASLCGAQARIHPCDVATMKGAVGLAKAARETFGRPPDLLLNNAGSWFPQKAEEAREEDFDAMLTANLRTSFLTTRAFLPEMLAQGSGSIGFVSSIAALRGLPGNSLYCAAKAGLLGYARALREELKPTGVRVLIFLPGATMTPAWDGSGVPASRLMSAQSVARAIAANSLLPADCVAEEIVLRPQLGDL